MPSATDSFSKTSHHLLHSFCLYPKLHFETKGDDEEVILFLRAHPITQLPWIFSTIVLVLSPILGNVIIAQFLNASEVLFLNLLWFSVVFSYAFLNAVSWLFNVGIVTNKRVLDFDFHMVLYKETSAAAFNDVADVTVKAGGFIPSFFNYGNVFVQTAGIEQNIEFLRVPRPTETVSIINQLSGKT